MAAAELWLAFWWWCFFKHWPKSACTGEIKPNLQLAKSARIFSALKSTLGRRLGTAFITFNHVVCSLVDLFTLRQLHTSYTKYVKLFFMVFDKRKSFFAVTSFLTGT